MLKRDQYPTIYIGATAGLGAVALATSSMGIGATLADPFTVLFLAALAATAQRLPVFLFRSSAISVAFAATIATYVLYGTGVGLWVNLVSAAVNAFTPRRKPLDKIIFNAGALTVSAYLASTTYQLVGGQVPAGAVVPTILAVFVSGLVYFATNSALTSGIISLTSGMSFTKIYRDNYSWMVVNYVATAVNGASLALAYQSLQLFGMLAFVMPLGVAWYSFKLYMMKSKELRKRNEELESVNTVLENTNVRLEESHLSVISALVGALEAKDPYTHGHSAGTMLHAVALARKLDLADDEVAQVQLAALFADIGKIGVAEHILRKPGPLGYTEWNEVKNHTIIGANLLANIPSLAQVRPIVLAHHERWDGTSYTNGLKGDEIPLAARIVSVADAFQAMTSERPYRPSLKRQQAIEELRRCAGTQFEPRLVETFIAILEEAVAAKKPEVRAGGHMFNQPVPVEAARVVQRGERPT